MTAAPFMAAVVLAAGQGRRFGGDKLLQPIKGAPMLSHVLSAVRAARLDEIIVTVRPHDAPLAAVVKAALSGGDTPWRLVEVSQADQGLSQSLQAGIAAVRQDAAATLVVLGDMPFVQPATLRRLCDAWRAGTLAVVPTHGGRPGNPVLLSRTLFPAVADVRGDMGARQLWQGLTRGVTRLEVGDPGIHQDIDFQENL